MKKVISLLVVLTIALGSCIQAQTACYWVFLTDKQGCTFDPYEYFDAKAIERYRANGFDLKDATNFPVNEEYATAVNQLATEAVGSSRWMNAVGVMATPEQIAQIEQLNCVARTQMLTSGPMVMTKMEIDGQEQREDVALSDQLIRMQGEQFRAAGLDGKGIRIAVFDGGFPRVNTHNAFKHLRDNNLIKDTWNFPNDKADVYGWNSHGLMTLSCITGNTGSQLLGLATGAEFLLYRTEVNLEPFKEEVWWIMAVERADQHGANIISSSLGYGKERYFAKDMDGTSYVAKAANMAARRGMLVVNSAGNENDSRQWRTIITPADADSVLCVGGIIPSLEEYKMISFSSCGPSADGRLKPEVCAFGQALTANTDGDNSYQFVSGTSFSCPLVAGFAACAWQASPGKTAKQMKEAIMRSADRYPYFDYALGYGVPQASYFVNKEQLPKGATFSFEETRDSVAVKLKEMDARANLFYNKQRPNGTLVAYNQIEVLAAQPEGYIRFHKASLDSCTLNVSYEGYSDSFSLAEGERVRLADSTAMFMPDVWMPRGKGHSHYKVVMSEGGEPKHPTNWGTCAPWWGGFYWQFGSMICMGGKEQNIRFSPVNHLGYRVMYAFTKTYKLGLGIEWAMANYHLDRDHVNPLDERLGTPGDEHVTKKYMKQGDWALELFQRVRLSAGGLVGNGMYWDLGVYGSISYYNYHVKYGNIRFPAELVETRFHNPNYIDRYKLNWGVTTRFVFDVVGIYFRYRLTGIFDNQYVLTSPNPLTGYYFNLPRFEAGLLLSF